VRRPCGAGFTSNWSIQVLNWHKISFQPPCPWPMITNPPSVLVRTTCRQVGTRFFPCGRARTIVVSWLRKRGWRQRSTDYGDGALWGNKGLFPVPWESYSYGDVRMHCFSCHRQLFPTARRGRGRFQHSRIRRVSHIQSTLNHRLKCMFVHAPLTASWISQPWVFTLPWFASSQLVWPVSISIEFAKPRSTFNAGDFPILKVGMSYSV